MSSSICALWVFFLDKLAETDDTSLVFVYWVFRIPPFIIPKLTQKSQNRQISLFNELYTQKEIEQSSAIYITLYGSPPHPLPKYLCEEGPVMS